MAFLSPGLALTERRLLSIGKRTQVKALSHSAGERVWRSWNKRALWRVVRAEVRM